MTRIDLTCQLCGSHYLVKPYRKSISKYCSWLCGQKAKGKLGGARKIALRGTGKKHKYVKFFGRHEHRVVAEQMLGRPLVNGEIVHHKDENGKNNAPSNLLVTTQSNHINLHRPAMLAARLEKAGY